MITVENALKLIAAVAISETAGLIGSLFTAPAIPAWYEGLVKPALNPPSWIFAPVWITLYALMGIASFIIWRAGVEKPEIKIALGVFLFQLILNAAWSVIFFGLQNPGLAFLDLILLFLFIIWTIKLFRKISRAAAWLFAPYLLWVAFAGYLNYQIWILN